MTSFVKQPNLPEGKVKAVICGDFCDELRDYLQSRGVELLEVSQNPYIDGATATHADMLAIHLHDCTVLVDEGQSDLTQALTDIGADVIVADRPVKGDYPNDISLNFVIMGKRIIGNIKYCDSMILQQLKDYKMLNCKQGYGKCSCLIIGENALITDDVSIYNTAKSNDIDCLLISKGDILLSGHEYGFIGGASGKVSENEVLFFGDVTKHRDYKKIADFIEKHGCEIIFLDFPLTDFGGIIPITEKAP